MPDDFPTVLTKLQSNADWICRHTVGSAWFGDTDEWDRLHAQFDDAVDALKTVYGEPTYVGPAQQSPARGFRCSQWDAVDRIAYWQQSDSILYGLLIAEDNGRTCELILGVCATGDLKAAPQGYWDR